MRPAATWASYVERPRSFYNDDVIDAAGKALMPVLDSLLRAGATLREPATIGAIRRAAAAGPVLYGARRAHGARTWVIVARTSAEAIPLVERMVALERDADGVVGPPPVLQ